MKINTVAQWDSLSKTANLDYRGVIKPRKRERQRQRQDQPLGQIEQVIK